METTIDTLVKGDTLLVFAKQVKGGKTQLEFAEHISSPYSASGNSLVSAFNKSDKRFSSKPRRAWISGEKADMEELLGIKLPELAEGSVKDLNILNPKVKGQRIRIQISETTTADDYQKDNTESQAKRAGSDGDFIFYKGKHIYSNTSVVEGEPMHTFLPGDPAEQDSAPVEAFEAPEELTA